MENPEKIIVEARNGREVWDILKTKYKISDNDFIVMLELCESRFDRDIKDLLTELSVRRGKKIFLVSYMDMYKYEECNVTIIKLNFEEYMLLRRFYIVTVFHKNIRVITDQEPFGNNKLLLSKKIETNDWVRKNFFKVD